MNGLVALVALVAAGLAGVVMVELLPSAAEPEPAPVAGRAPVAAVTEARTLPAATAKDDSLLARPLFSQTRRPPTVAGPTMGAGAEPLPRMTGILIDGPNRRAIFAGAQGGKAVVVVEGGHLGAFTVQSIEPRQVTVTGPGGPRTLRTAFDPSLPAPAAPAAISLVPPQFPGIQLPGTLPGGPVSGGSVVSPGVPSSPYYSQPSTPGFDAGNGSPPGAAR